MRQPLDGLGPSNGVLVRLNDVKFVFDNVSVPFCVSIIGHPYVSVEEFEVRSTEDR